MLVYQRVYVFLSLFGGSHKWGYPKMDGLEWNILFKWMVWGYPHF